MTTDEKTTTTYVGHEDVVIEAERFSAKQPQIRNTVSNARKHYLVRKNGSRSEIQVGDFIIRGDDGQVDSMPAPLFHQLFGIYDQKAAAIAKDKAAAQAKADEAEKASRPELTEAEAIQESDDVDAANAAEAEAEDQAEAAADAADAAEETTTDEPPVNAADAVDYSGAPTHGDDDKPADDAEKEAAVTHAESIFTEDDKPADPPAKRAKKKRGKKK